MQSLGATLDGGPLGLTFAGQYTYLPASPSAQSETFDLDIGQTPDPAPAPQCKLSSRFIHHELIFFSFLFSSSFFFLFLLLFSFFFSFAVTQLPQADFFPANNLSEALMLTWVTKVATFLPDWALSSLDLIIRDPGFNANNMRNLLLLRDLKEGPLRNVPSINVIPKTTPSGPVRVAEIASVVKQAFGIPQVSAHLPKPIPIHLFV